VICTCLTSVCQSGDTRLLSAYLQKQVPSSHAAGPQHNAAVSIVSSTNTGFKPGQGATAWDQSMRGSTVMPKATSSTRALPFPCGRTLEMKTQIGQTSSNPSSRSKPCQLASTDTLASTALWRLAQIHGTGKHCRSMAQTRCSCANDWSGTLALLLVRLQIAARLLAHLLQCMCKIFWYACQNALCSNRGWPRTGSLGQFEVLMQLMQLIQGRRHRHHAEL